MCVPVELHLEILALRRVGNGNKSLRNKSSLLADSPCPDGFGGLDFSE
jgi:hypothetical protein